MSESNTTTTALLAAFAARVVQRSRPFAVQQDDGSYRWVYEDVMPATLLAHLQGEQTLALSSADDNGLTRWLCLDVDEPAPDALSRLLAACRVFGAMGLPGLVEASRRGGHLWLFLERPFLVATARAAVLQALADLQTHSAAMPAYELYPDAGAQAPDALGHAVRLPLGIHRLTGKRYPLFDDAGWPCAFTSTAAALRFVCEWPHVDTAVLLALAARWAERDQQHEVELPSLQVEQAGQRSHGGAGGETSKVGTRSSVIRWVDAQVSPLDLLAELAPEVEMTRTGRGYLGWCPFHDDRASDEHGRPGTKSFYVVLDRRYGWSWRCLSSNCGHHDGLMRHSFRLFQELAGLTASAAVVEAVEWWPDSGRAKPLHTEEDETSTTNKTTERGA